MTVATVQRLDDGRATVVWLVTTVYLLLLFEGVLRKWLLPELSQVIFFARDPLVAAAFLLAVRTGRVRVDPLLLWFLIGSMVCAVVALMQFAAGAASLTVIGYGYRNYFFYLLLALATASCLDGDDVARLVRWTLVAAIPVAGLVYIQVHSPPFAWINRGLEEGDQIFQVIPGLVRPYGTFTFTAGHVLFVASLLAMLPLAWLDRARYGLSPPALVAATASVLLLAVTTGSRAIIFHAVLVGGALLVAGSTTPLARVRGRLSLVLIGVSVGVALAASVVMASSIDALRERMAQAEAIEGSPIERAFSGFTKFVQVMPESPVLGFGMGSGTNGGAFAAVGARTFTLAEDEWSRIILELGPPLGLAYIGLRILLVLWLARLALRANRERGDPTALLLLGFVGIVVLNGQITLQGTINGYGWMFTGLVIAAARSSPAEAWMSHPSGSAPPAEDLRVYSDRSLAPIVPPSDPYERPARTVSADASASD